MLGSVICCY